MSTTHITAAKFSVAGVMTIIVPLDCSAPALVHRMAAAQYLAALAMAAVVLRDVLNDTDD